MRFYGTEVCCGLQLHNCSSSNRCVGVFRRMFPHAQKYNLRLIAIHQREYLGSSPFTEDELALLYSDDPEDQATILREQAHAIAKVMAHVIAQGNLPLPRQSDGAHEGGIVILGRSAGCAHVLALLGNLDSLDKSMYSLLEKYVTTIIIHGAYISARCPGNEGS